MRASVPEGSLRGRAIAGRVAFGFIGATANALALFGTIVGALIQSIHDQEHGTKLAPYLHLGYAILNAGLMGFLLTSLGDEDRSALGTAALWAIGSFLLWIAYWSWVL